MEYQQLPGHSRVWIYQSNRELTPKEIDEITAAGNQFVSEWQYHGTDLRAAFEIFNKLFIVFFVDEGVQNIGGCSIDRSVTFVKGLMEKYHLDLLDRMNIAYRDGDKITLSKMHEFSQLVKQGKVNADTIVFNNLVKDKQEFVSDWETKAKNSWHKQLL